MLSLHPRASKRSRPYCDFRAIGTMRGVSSLVPLKIGKNRSKTSPSKSLVLLPPLDFQTFLRPWACMSATSCSTLNSAAWRKEYAK